METTMKVRTLDHVNIRTERVAETVEFYTTMLGMVVKPPPGGTDTSRGAWIYDDDDRPVLHVGSYEARYPGDGMLKNAQAPTVGTGNIHHVALECLGYDELVARLKAANLQIATSDIPSIQLRQVFVEDPNGVTLELNFRGAAAA
jgi:catechol 2,3-dioxygenase-like lactoylglutathione lyase family enzyme